jgi:predicted peptidase
MVRAVERAGGSPRFTVFSEAEHDCWTAAYRDPELYRWLLAQRRVAR